MKGSKLIIFGISQMYEYKLFVFEYYQEKIVTLKKYKNVHKSTLVLSEMITDLYFQANSMVSVSRDKKINLYQVKFV